MNEDMRDIGRGTIRRIDWQELLPVTFMVRTFKIAASFRPIMLSVFGIVLMMIVGVLINGIVVYSSKQAETSFVDHGGYEVEELLSLPNMPGSQGVREEPLVDLAPLYRPDMKTPITWENNRIVCSGSSFWLQVKNTVFVPWEIFTASFTKIFSSGYSGFERLLSCVWFIWMILLGTCIGGAITRTAGVKLAAGQYEDGTSLKIFLNEHWRSYIGAILIPIIGIFLCAIPLLLMPWALGVPVLNVIVAVLFPIVIIAAGLMVLIGLAFLFAWPLMFAAVSVEGTDAFDAVSRGFSYVGQRPLQYIVYFLAGSLIGYLGWLLISFLLDGISMLLLSYAEIPKTEISMLFEEFARSETAETVAKQQSAPGFIIGLWMMLLGFLKLAYVFAFFWVSSTAVYLLLRKSVDNVPLDVVKRVGKAAKTRKLPAEEPTEEKSTEKTE